MDIKWQPITPEMIETMSSDEVKQIGLRVRLRLKDGSNRTGIYKNFCKDPSNRYDFRDAEFIQFEDGETHDLVSIVITEIIEIAWSL